MSTQTLTITAVCEPEPGPRLKSLLDEYWPAYRRWMRRAPPVEPGEAASELREHMPELFPVYERLARLAGGGAEASRFLTLYRPPRLVRACTQAVLETDDGPVLLRSYDHSPELFDGVVLLSAWSGAPTLAVTDCLWGALDGVNGHGLAVALAFGGRNAEGPGFAAPLIVRYLLETCACTADACAALRRLPVYMPYIFVVADSAGEHATAHLSPDRPPVLEHRRASANHLSPSDWPEYCRFSASVERLERAEALVRARAPLGRSLGAFLAPPLWRTGYAEGAGTLYAAAYSPATRRLELHWPAESVAFSLDDFEEREISVRLPSPAAASSSRSSPGRRPARTRRPPGG